MVLDQTHQTTLLSLKDQMQENEMTSIPTPTPTCYFFVSKILVEKKVVWPEIVHFVKDKDVCGGLCSSHYIGQKVKLKCMQKNCSVSMYFSGRPSSSKNRDCSHARTVPSTHL